MRIAIFRILIGVLTFLSLLLLLPGILGILSLALVFYLEEHIARLMNINVIKLPLGNHYEYRQK